MKKKIFSFMLKSFWQFFLVLVAINVWGWFMFPGVN